jgi:PAS domain S-box-containing protein
MPPSESSARRRPRLLPSALIAILLLAALGGGVAWLLIRDQRHIVNLARAANESLLPQVDSQLRVAVNIEKLRQFGDAVRTGKTAQERRDARLTADILAVDSTFDSDPEFQRQIVAVNDTIRRMEQLRAGQDDLRREIEARLAQADAALAQPLPAALLQRLQALRIHAGDAARAMDAGAKDSEHLARQLEASLPPSAASSVRQAVAGLAQIPELIRRIAEGDQEADALWNESRMELDELTQHFSTDAAVSTSQTVEGIARSAEQASDMLLWALLVMAVSAIGAGLLLRSFVVKPILRATLGLNAVRAGRQDVAPVQEWLAEMDDIAQAVGRFAQALRQREKSEALLRETDHWYRSLIASAPTGLLVANADGTIKLANEYVEKLFGYAPGELVGRPVECLVPGDPGNMDWHRGRRQEYWQSPERKLMGEGKCAQARHRDGFEIPVEVGLSPMPALVGQQPQVAVSITDMSSRVENDKALHAAKTIAEDAARSKSMFLANMSHEIRTPMNAIIGLSHLALATALTPKQHDYLTKIHRAGNYLLGILNDILDFSKIEAGKLNMESLHFDFEEVLDNVTTLAGHKANEKGLELLYKIPADMPSHLVGDPLRLGQVLVNLLNNAVKFTERGEVEIGVERLRQDAGKIQLRFTVRDTGIGMKPEESARLFQAFAQADGSTTRKYGGTGLGLSIAKHLVEMMAGEIWVESQEGQGSRFIFTAWFGIAAEQPKRRRVLPDSLSGLRVLVVDDNASAREILADMLRRFTFQVDTADSGAQAVAAVLRHDAETPYRLVFMDLSMPGMDGIAATHAIKSHAELSTPPAVVMVTAFDRDEARRQAEAAAVDGFLVKPVNPSTLFDSLATLLAAQAPVLQRPRSPEPLRQDGLQGMRILLAEDNDINQQIAVELLESVGVAVDLAVNGREAVEKALAAQPSYDAILMDLQMPEMDGFEAARAIRADARCREIPILAMTAHALTEERERSLACGMNDHITKPIDPDALFCALKHWLPDKRLEPVAPMPAEAAPWAIPGIDTAAALRRMAGKPALYLKLLRQFAQEQPHTAEYIRQALAAGDRTTAERLAHSAKSVCGNIGAVAAQDAAGRLEKLLESSGDTAAQQAALAAFTGSLDEAIGHIRQALDTLEIAEPPPGQAEPQNRQALPAQLAQLAAYLADDDSEAQECFAGLRETLRPLCEAGDFAALEQAIQGFDYAAAQERLRRIAQGIAP